jgi:transposase-like protein
VGRKVKHTPEERLKIVLEGLQGEDSVAEVCRRYGIYPTGVLSVQGISSEGGIRGTESQS